MNAISNGEVEEKIIWIDNETNIVYLAIFFIYNPNNFSELSLKAGDAFKNHDSKILIGVWRSNIAFLDTVKS
jgi:hypothetical protein